MNSRKLGTPVAVAGMSAECRRRCLSDLVSANYRLADQINASRKQLASRNWSPEQKKLIMGNIERDESESRRVRELLAQLKNGPFSGSCPLKEEVGLTSPCPDCMT